MTPSKFQLLTAALLVALPGWSAADSKPRGAQPASYEKIATAYAGKTELWGDNCNGGIYFAPNWQARAWCADTSENFGAGRWSVEPGGLVCHDLTWYWPNGARAGASPGGKTCVSHVVDRWGKLWRNWPGSAEWWPLDGSGALVRGYKLQQQVQQTQRRLGM
ncbi:DUF995 domain-containing protein [Marimonas arenosa]|uniref:DUF995 domain-containing protein n=1 Tax=Marimonas arenosa TaxID=1795305 RepID=A0AAE3WIL8_9RHOB|nr:DUF995 domain-containing protein [Marimonas arenosa]MDQ2092158.1 DUF995 domain-containing protein [Marimonas arenosa]